MAVVVAVFAVAVAVAVVAAVVAVVAVVAAVVVADCHELNWNLYEHREKHHVTVKPMNLKLYLAFQLKTN